MDKVLVVDDDSEIRNIIGIYLTNNGCEVEFASNGKEAIELMDESFDLIILDIMMPVMDGMTVLPILREKHNTPEGKLDKNGNPLKFHRDLDSDWVVQNDKPHYGLKEHASVDINHGFILVTTLTPASVNDTNYLPYCTVYSRHTKQPIEKVFADKGYLPS